MGESTAIEDQLALILKSVNDLACNFKSLENKLDTYFSKLETLEEETNEKFGKIEKTVATKASNVDCKRLEKKLNKAEKQPELNEIAF